MNILQPSDLSPTSFSNNGTTGAGGLALRTDSGSTFHSKLAADTTAALIGSKAAGPNTVSRTVADRLDDAFSPKDIGAVGDGVADDTTSFTTLEVTHTGKDIDLGGLTYLVTTIPTKNNYFNGSFKTVNGTVPVGNNFDYTPPAFHNYGGQLIKLRQSLTNPLVQSVGIVFVGDSITWGRTLVENGVFDPRDGTLSDPRDNFTTPSYVNQFKRYIGSQYARSATPVLSNWVASPSGQSTAEYSVTNLLYPREFPFTFASSGPSISATEVTTSATPSGYQYQLADGNLGGSSWQKISFPFTGTTFTFIFACVDASAIDYELIVDGISQGLFSTASGSGVVAGNNQRRTHTFDYVDDKLIEIKTNRAAYSTGTRVLRVEGIEVTKTIKITNQGINGATTKSYALYNLSGGFNDGVAVGPQDKFIFMQLGTNDRISTATTPKGVQGFQRNLTGILNTLSSLGNLILMVAPPAANESTATYSFTMQDCRNTLLRESENRSLDFIDNYALFNGLNLSVFTADGLHPNARGMQRITQNIIGSIEQASDVSITSTTPTVFGWRSTTTSTTIGLDDVANGVAVDNAAAVTVTVPNNATVAIPVGSSVLVTADGTGVLTLVAAGGVNLRVPAGLSLSLTGQYSVVTLIKRGTDTWYVAGDLATA